MKYSPKTNGVCDAGKQVTDAVFIGGFMLRWQQIKMAEKCDAIKKGSGVRIIPGDVAPGGGKTVMALVAVNSLVGEFVDYAIIVAPRTNLKNQFERDSLDDLVFEGNIIRAAENTNNLLRGTQGYITTIQAIVANQELHYRENIGNRYLLIVDEYQHIIEGSEWCNALKPLIDGATVFIPMSGTFDIDDGFLYKIPYIDGEIDKTDTKEIEWITYSRKNALEDGAILPIQFSMFNVSGSYEKDGEITEFSEIGYDKAALISAIESDAAKMIIDKAVDHWSRYRKEIGAYAQGITVDATIKAARETLEYILSLGLNAEIAVSEDASSDDVIARFCDGKVDWLCSVGKVYEGLSAVRCTHLVSLTHIRSKNWIAQMIARVQRNFGNKKKGYVFCPNDGYMREIVNEIQNEIAQVTKERSMKDERKPNPFPNKKKSVNPLFTKIQGYRNLSDVMTVSMVERALRKELCSCIAEYVDRKSHATLNGKDIIVKTMSIKREMMLWKMIKIRINNGRDGNGKIIKKPVDEMSINELEQAISIVRAAV